MNADRQLVSIFFADIAGYTAMMQADEGKAISRVGRFREILEDEVSKNGGRVVQNYGDGALCIFNSVLGSVKAAESAQLLFQQTPEVPVRIGIHLGDVIFKEGDVYGDAVNVTSRIESMGEPGAVLISNDTFQKIKNRSELKFESLGSYKFKNIEEPMEVRALKSPGLKIPDRRNVQGKFAETSSTTGWWKWAVAAMILLALGFGISQVTTGSKGNTVLAGLVSEELPTIAVLPFRNLSEPGESTFLAEGIMEDLLNKLSKLNQVNVISRTSSMKFKNSEKTITEIADELGADYYVEGSVQKSGDHVRVSANLISAESDNPLWSHTSDERIEDIFEVQGKISLAIAKLLVATIRPETESTILAVPTKDFDAWENYVQSLDLVASRRPEQMSEAIGLLNNAINTDPGFSEAYGVLAEAYLMMGYFGIERNENYSKAKATAEQGIKVNPSIGRSYAILGNLHQYQGEWEAAIIDFEKAIEFSPNDGTVNKWYSLIFTNINQNERALAYTRKAKEVDPLIASSHLFQVQALLVGGKTEEARSLLTQIDKQFPDEWQSGWMMARSYLTDGLYEKAIEVYLKNPLKDSPFLKSEMAFCYGKLGEKEKASSLFEDIDPDDPKYHYYAAHLYTGLNEIDQAFNSLNVIAENDLYDLVVFLIKPEGAALKKDPRYWQFMSELGLKDYWEEGADLVSAE